MVTKEGEQAVSERDHAGNLHLAASRPSEAEIAKDDAFLAERMRADGDVKPAAGERGEQFARGPGLPAHDFGNVVGDFAAGRAGGFEIGGCHCRRN